jgi:hypothetical protein
MVRLTTFVLLFASHAVYANAPFPLQSPDHEKANMEQRQEDALTRLEKIAPLIDAWKKPISEFQKDVLESSKDLADILDQVGKKLAKSADCADAALASSDRQFIEFKYAQTKLYLSLARVELTRAASLALRTDGIESYAKPFLAMGQTMDDVIASF